MLQALQLAQRLGEPIDHLVSVRARQADAQQRFAPRNGRGADARDQQTSLAQQACHPHCFLGPADHEGNDLAAGRTDPPSLRQQPLAQPLGTLQQSGSPARLGAHEKDVAVYRMESGGIELLKRIYYFAKRIARTVGSITEEPEG